MAPSLPSPAPRAPALPPLSLARFAKGVGDGGGCVLYQGGTRGTEAVRNRSPRPLPTAALQVWPRRLRW